MLINENKYWSNVRHGTEFGGDYESFYIKFMGDTVISETLYKKVYRSNDSLMSNWLFEGSIRETDTGSVHYLPKNSSTEVLLLDYGVKEGDSIDINIDYVEYLFVDSIRIKAFGIHNEFRKHIFLSLDHIYNSDVWIDGVGSLHGILFHPSKLGLVGEVNNLVCFFENDSLKYHQEFYSSCFPYGKYLAIQNPLVNHKIEILNQRDVVIVYFEQLGLTNFFFRLIDINGRVVIFEDIIEKEFLSINKNQLESGIYIYTIQNKNIFFSGKIYIN